MPHYLVSSWFDLINCRYRDRYRFVSSLEIIVNRPAAPMDMPRRTTTWMVGLVFDLRERAREGGRHNAYTNTYTIYIYIYIYTSCVFTYALHIHTRHKHLYAYVYIYIYILHNTFVHIHLQTMEATAPSGVAFDPASGFNMVARPEYIYIYIYIHRDREIYRHRYRYRYRYMHNNNTCMIQ